MPSSSYTSGHPLADIIRERLQDARSLSQVHDELARQIASGEIVITPLLPQGWRLRQMEDRLRRVVIETDSERYELYEYRCHFPQTEPRLSCPQATVATEEPPRTDSDLQPEPPQPNTTATPKTPQVWFAEALKALPRQQGEQPDDYARRLYQLMQVANLTKPWSFGTLKRRLYDRLPDDKPAR